MPDKKFRMPLAWQVDPDAFLDELRHWDGTFKTVGRGLVTYTSVDRINADVAQTVAVTHGRTASARFTESGKYSTGELWKVSLRDRPAPTARISWRLNGIAHLHRTVVYGILVPSSYVLVRRRGKVSVSCDSRPR